MEIFKKASKPKSRKLLIFAFCLVLGALGALIILLAKYAFNPEEVQQKNLAIPIENEVNTSAVVGSNDTAGAGPQCDDAQSFVTVNSRSNFLSQARQEESKIENLLPYQSIANEEIDERNYPAEVTNSAMRSFQDVVDRQNDPALAERMKDVVCPVCQLEKAVTFAVCQQDDRHRCCYQCFEELKRNLKNNPGIPRKCPICRQRLHPDLELNDQDDLVSVNNMSSVLQMFARRR